VIGISVLKVLASSLTLLALFSSANEVTPQEQAASSSAGPSSELFLPSDYLPLSLGNRWIYSRTDSRFKKTDMVKVEVISTPIIKWKTYYVVSHLPFVPGLENANNVLIRFDDATKKFLRLTPEGEAPLFPVGESADARFDVSVDENQKQMANRMSYLTCPDCADSGMEIVFDRGIGPVSVGLTFSWGAESYDLKSAEVNGRHFGEVIAPEKSNTKALKSGPVVSRADPNLNLEIEKKETEARLALKVKNPTDSFLSFKFGTSQDYDFVVREKESGLEIWRWSKGLYFSKVLRDVALLPEKEWRFEVFWDFKDNERNDIKHGTYQAVGILTTKEPRESEPMDITFP
jgi:Intracellular proteinase inhibitor